MSWKNFESWLETLYKVEEVYLVDYALEQGWEERILEEFEAETLIELQCFLDEDSGGRADSQRKCRILLLCLKYCYPVCEGCDGDHMDCPHCYYGLSVPSDLL